MRLEVPSPGLTTTWRFDQKDNQPFITTRREGKKGRGDSRPGSFSGVKVHGRLWRNDGELMGSRRGL